MKKDKRGNPSIAEHGKATRFKKGQSGNPKGRPKGTGITNRLIRILEENEGHVSEALAKAATAAALKGDFRFWKEIIDRVDGKVPDKVQNDAEVTVRVVYEDEDEGRPQDDD